jgi:hypothetical protein
LESEIAKYQRQINEKKERERAIRKVIEDDNRATEMEIKRIEKEIEEINKAKEEFARKAEERIEEVDRQEDIVRDMYHQREDRNGEGRRKCKE